MRGEVTTFNHFRIKPVSVDTEERETTHHRHEGYGQSGQLVFAVNGVYVVKLRQGSGKDRQGMALMMKGLKA